MSQRNIKMYQAAAKSPHSFVTFIFHVLFEKSQWEKLRKAKQNIAPLQHPINSANLTERYIIK